LLFSLLCVVLFLLCSFLFFGEIDALQISVGLKLNEFRSMFERVHAQGIHEIDVLMKESVNFGYCYKQFLNAQGKMVSDFYIIFFNRFQLLFFKCLAGVLLCSMLFMLVLFLVLCGSARSRRISG
jgi:hypothetical protein